MKFTPNEFIAELGKSVIGQEDAKKTIAVALRNRWRRTQLDGAIKKKITPKNILMIGPTGVGKTAIIRAIADLIDAPMVKVEATKFTQIGYVGSSVNSMIEQLAVEGYNKFNELKKSKYINNSDHMGILLVKKANIIIDEIDRILKAEMDKVADLFFKADMVDFDIKRKKGNFYTKDEYGEFKKDYLTGDHKIIDWCFSNHIVIELMMMALGYYPEYILKDVKSEAKKQKFNSDLIGTIKFYFEKNEILSAALVVTGLRFQNAKLPEKFLRDFLVLVEKEIPEEKHKYFQAYIDYIYTFLEEDPFIYDDKTEETSEVRKYKNHIEYIENMGIVFIDEIDKLGDKNTSTGDNVGKMGVQRDLLALLDGTTVETDKGNINTDNILFIGAGAFHVSSVADLMPELLGRLPIQVKLNEMNYDVLKEILINKDISPINQYIELLNIDKVHVNIEEGVIDSVAKLTNDINNTFRNMGARTLHLVVDKLFSEYACMVSDDDKEIEINITEDNVKNIRKEFWQEKNREFLKNYISQKYSPY